ncbi:MAG: hypothetical protein II629_05420 [Ruminococcus sp.]|nr:hypothetical protein [Ruminococcus sp.]
MLFYDVTQIAEVTRNGSLSDESDTASGNPGTNNIPQASGNVNAESVKDSLRLTGLTRCRHSCVMHKKAGRPLGGATAWFYKFSFPSRAIISRSAPRSARQFRIPN